MTTAKEQFAQFLVKGYAPVKWLLKYLCATAAIRIFDYGKTFPQFYAAFTKRLDTLGIFVSVLVQSGLQFCINIAMDNKEENKSTALCIKERLRGFNEFMAQNILPLVNNTTNDPRKCWLKMEATCMLTRELEMKGKRISSMDDPEFKLTFYEFQTRNMKLPSVDTMAKDLYDLDRRLRRRGPKGGEYYQHQQPQGSPNTYPRRDQNTYTQNGRRWDQHQNNRGDPRKLHRNNEQQQRYPWRGYQNNPGRGRDRRGRREERYGNRDRGRRRGRDRSELRSRSRSRDRNIETGKERIPDFEEGYDSQWQKKKGSYEYKNGNLYGNARLESKICGYFKDAVKTCTFGYRRCKWHHMCAYCYVIGQHNANKCPNRRAMII